jgi:hypothetical protein
VTRDAKLDALADVALLAHCPDRELRAVAEAGDLIHVRRGTLLASPDDRPNPLLPVVRGDAHRFSADGVAPYVRGTLHGAAEELAGARRDEHVVAASEADVLVLDPRRLLPLLEQCPVLTLSLLRQVAATVQTARCASSPETSNGSTTRRWAKRSSGTSTTTPSFAIRVAPGT